MKFSETSIKKILLDGAYITEEDIVKAEEFSKTHRTTGLIEYLLGEGIITKDIIGQAIAEAFHLSYADLHTNPPSREQVLKIPEEVARKFRAVLFSENETEAVVASDHPRAQDIEAELGKVFPEKTIKITFALAEDIDASFVYYQKALELRFEKIIEGKTRVAPELLEAIFSDALALNVSDIHFEPIDEVVLIRFRIDGVLRDAGRLPIEHYENMLNRIKVQSGIRLDEHFAAQDGSMQFVNDDVTIDLRTSVVPTVEGEKVVLRVLSSYVQGLTLSELGLSGAHQKLLEETAAKPFGMIMVVGPTGSGKTTTLYALLKVLNKSDVNITTIEDPVEYKMKGLNQIQVNTLTGLTFAKGLRSIVRQDPDTILVGEIRDMETAEIAVNAALTGHLLLSTFHANDAATSIPRLLDMGVEPFLLASTLELVIAQRLARRICSHCRVGSVEELTEVLKKREDLKEFFPDKKITLYEGKGCDACGHSGYKGRTAIYEFIPITPEIQDLILKNPSAQELWKVAHKQGAQMLFEDGVTKVKNGITTLEELLRVAEPPQF